LKLIVCQLYMKSYFQKLDMDTLRVKSLQAFHIDEHVVTHDRKITNVIHVGISACLESGTASCFMIVFDIEDLM